MQGGESTERVVSARTVECMVEPETVRRVKDNWDPGGDQLTERLEQNSTHVPIPKQSITEPTPSLFHRFDISCGCLKEEALSVPNPSPVVFGAPKATRTPCVLLLFHPCCNLFSWTMHRTP